MWKWKSKKTKLREAKAKAELQTWLEERAIKRHHAERLAYMAISPSVVLDKINAGRVALGVLPLSDIRRGHKSASHSCPIANSLRDAVGSGVSVGTGSVAGLPRARAFAYAKAVGGEVTEINGVATVANPPEFSRFVREFDGGYFPQYVAA